MLYPMLLKPRSYVILVINTVPCCTILNNGLDNGNPAENFDASTRSIGMKENEPDVKDTMITLLKCEKGQTV
jgi:hypothetical protein